MFYSTLFTKLMYALTESLLIVALQPLCSAGIAFHAIAACMKFLLRAHAQTNGHCKNKLYLLVKRGG